VGSLSPRLLSLLAAAAAAAGVLSFPTPAAAQELDLPCLAGDVLPLGDCEPDEQPEPDPEPEPAPAPAPAPSPAPRAPSRGGCADANLNPSARNRERLAVATLCLLNRERRKRGLRPLKRNRTLDRVAASYSRQMVRGQFFDHVSPRGTTLVQRVRTTSYLQGLRRWSLGENLAWGTGTLGSPAETVRSWMRSPGHRRNILDRRFREIGIGATVGIPTRIRNAPTGATYAHVFGLRVRR
jgi:uncharacterized protein YkwD